MKHENRWIVAWESGVSTPFDMPGHVTTEDAALDAADEGDLPVAAWRDGAPVALSGHLGDWHGDRT